MDAVSSAIAQKQAGILGIHLEGPFANPDRKGIHATEPITSFNCAEISLLTTLPKSGTTLLTVAPEQLSDASIRLLTQAGVLVFCDHSNATYERIVDAIEHGRLCGVTHLFTQFIFMVGQSTMHSSAQPQLLLRYLNNTDNVVA
ncbi:hypothetical protein ACO0K7_03280 [Undibacterium sp. Ji67W]|uniref:hypothetical protein n=1 Tax=Undibacterium sp. Ji67W TaxID=3413042 RepID=UPI003BF00FEB